MPRKICCLSQSLEKSVNDLALLRLCVSYKIDPETGDNCIDCPGADQDICRLIGDLMGIAGSLAEAMKKRQEK